MGEQGGCYKIGHNCIISINNYYLLIEISLLRETVNIFRLSVNHSKLFYCMATIKYAHSPSSVNTSRPRSEISL